MKRCVITAVAVLSGTLGLCSCGYIDFRRGTYESIRSRDATASPSSNRTTLPPYDQYERERANAAKQNSPEMPVEEVVSEQPP
jgi:hypothetical protein